MREEKKNIVFYDLYAAFLWLDYCTDKIGGFFFASANTIRIGPCFPMSTHGVRRFACFEMTLKESNHISIQMQTNEAKNRFTQITPLPKRMNIEINEY